MCAGRRSLACLLDKPSLKNMCALGNLTPTLYKNCLVMLRMSQRFQPYNFHGDFISYKGAQEVEIVRVVQLVPYYSINQNHNHSNLSSQNRLDVISSFSQHRTLHFYFYQIFFYLPVIPIRQASHIYSFSLPHKIQINFNHLIHLFYKGLKLRVHNVE